MSLAPDAALIPLLSEILDQQGRVDGDKGGEVQRAALYMLQAIEDLKSEADLLKLERERLIPERT